MRILTGIGDGYYGRVGKGRAGLENDTGALELLVKLIILHSWGSDSSQSVKGRRAVTIAFQELKSEILLTLTTYLLATGVLSL